MKKDPKPLNPFYRAVFPLDRDKFLTTDGHSLMDKDWGRAIGFVLARHRCGRAHNPLYVEKTKKSDIKGFISSTGLQAR